MILFCYKFIPILLFSAVISISAQPRKQLTEFSIARIKYQGGGDWYNDPSAIPNLVNFMLQNTRVKISNREAKLTLTDERLYSHPILFITGHGKLELNRFERDHLINYLLKGGFLYVDDDYGLDPSFRKLMRDLFPDKPLLELPFSHGIYHTHFSFPNGLPKIHEHDNNPPQGFGIFDDNGRLMIFYTFETNLSDGWADPQIHNDPPQKRAEALRMGTNIIIWALNH